jgi:dihydrofolate synthase/folylpolyglutamate synthase
MAPVPSDPIAALFSLEKLGIKFGLENIRAVTEALGRPQDAWPSVIVAGTNGKGSVAAMVETGLRASGRRTGLYTSPHLVRLEERFAIDGRPVPSGRLRDSADRVFRAIASARAAGALLAEPTFFEATTAVAFDLFREARVDVAVLEVGLGGRFDATNVVAPVAGAITTIDLDHQQLLGHSLGAIAAEKAGIIKPGMRVVVGERKPEAFDVIARACAERAAGLVIAGDGVSASIAREMAPGPPAEPVLLLSLRTPVRDYGTVRLSLRGRHQADNAVVAVRLLESLEEAGLPVPPAAIRAAMAGTRWPGRLDLRRLDRGRAVLFDAAHNPAGAAVLASYLEEFAPAGLPIVFAIMKDKDAAGTLAPILPYARPLIAVRPATPRAMAPEEVAAMARRLGPTDRVEVEPDAGAALEAAWRRADVIGACGSIFLVGEAFERLGLSPW